MKILYIVPWSVPFDQANLQDIVNTQFGYYMLKEKNVKFVVKENGEKIAEFWFVGNALEYAEKLL